MFEFVPAHANAECESTGATWAARSSNFSPPELSLVMCEPNSFELLRRIYDRTKPPNPDKV